MRLSIVTINFNNRAGLQKTIDSIVAQTCQDFEWIVIDGGSTDGSKELIERYAIYISYWVSETDKGIYNAMNKGINASHGTYLLFLNSGDYLYDADVIRHILPLLKDKDYYIGKQQIGHIIRNFEILNYDDLVFLAVRYLPHQATFMRRSVFEKYGLYNEKMCIAADWELFFNSIIYGDVEAENLPFIISVYNLNGISTRLCSLARRETEAIKRQNRGVYSLVRFYKENYEKINALDNSKWFYFVFRICYWIYRKMRGRKHG